MQIRQHGYVTIVRNLYDHNAIIIRQKNLLQTSSRQKYSFNMGKRQTNMHYRQHTLQHVSFCVAEAYLLHAKRHPFATLKDTFHKALGINRLPPGNKAIPKQINPHGIKMRKKLLTRLLQ